MVSACCRVIAARESRIAQEEREKRLAPRVTDLLEEHLRLAHRALCRRLIRRHGASEDEQCPRQLELLTQRTEQSDGLFGQFRVAGPLSLHPRELAGDQQRPRPTERGRGRIAARQGVRDALP